MLWVANNGRNQDVSYKLNVPIWIITAVQNCSLFPALIFLEIIASLCWNLENSYSVLSLSCLFIPVKDEEAWSFLIGRSYDSGWIKMENALWPLGMIPHWRGRERGSTLLDLSFSLLWWTMGQVVYYKDFYFCNTFCYFAVISPIQYH